MTGPYISLEDGHMIMLEQTLETQYLQGRYGAVPNINVKTKSQFTTQAMKVIDKTKLVDSLRNLADRIEGEDKQ